MPLNFSIINYNKITIQYYLQVLYATDEDSFNEAVNNIQNLKDKFPTFVKRFENYLKRKNEWVLMYRRDILTKGNNTNNYAEACIRIFKEIILNRTKAYNVVALFEFICHVWEDYLILRILDHANNGITVVIIFSGVIVNFAVAYQI